MCLSSVTPPRKVIRSYRATNSAEYRLVGPTLDLASNTFTIPIPDDISQATGGRLKFSRQGDRFSNAAFWDGTGIICVNRFAWTGYGVPTVCKVMLPDWMAENRTIGTIQSSDPQGVILQLPKEAIQSSNRIVLTLPANIYIGDMHLEVDFPAGYTGSYTAPVPWFGNSLSGPSFHPAAGIVVGPALRLGKIGGAKLWEPQGLRKAMADPAGVTVNTMMVVVEGEVDAAVGLEMFGKATGILRIELQLDRKVVQTWTFPSPGVLYYYFMTEIDVAGIAPGVHEIFAIAYDASGAASMPSYSFPTNILNNRPTYVGAYFPARITVT